MEDKRTYSLNKIAYLLANDIQDVIWGIDDNDKCYIVVNDDITKCLDKYRTDIFLHAFLGAYAEVRRKIKELKENNN